MMFIKCVKAMKQNACLNARKSFFVIIVLLRPGERWNLPNQIYLLEKKLNLPASKIYSTADEILLKTKKLEQYVAS